MDIPVRQPRSAWGSSLMAQSPSGRVMYGPWDGPFACSPGTSITKTLYINSAGLCFGELCEELEPSSGEGSTSPASEPASPRVNRRELARVMGILPPQRGTNEAMYSRSLDGTSPHQKLKSNDSVRRFATLRQPRKMN